MQVSYNTKNIWNIPHKIFSRDEQDIFRLFENNYNNEKVYEIEI